MFLCRKPSDQSESRQNFSPDCLAIRGYGRHGMRACIEFTVTSGGLAIGKVVKD